MTCSKGDIEEIRAAFSQKLETYDKIRKDVKGLQTFIKVS